MASTLEEVRLEINDIDRQIITLLTKRQSFVKQAATFKKDEVAVRDEDRVKAVLGRIKELAIEEGLDADLAVNVYRTLINGFIALELREHRRE